MRATKENAEMMKLLLHRHANKLPAEAYDRLFSFIKACIARLPRAETVAKDLEAKARKRQAS